MRTVKLDNRGMSLIEVLAAVLILMVVWLALMQMSVIGYRENMKNILRDEAINVAAARMNELRSLRFGHVDMTQTSDTGVVEPVVARLVRSSLGPFNFTPTRIIKDINTFSKQVTLSIAWTWRGKGYTHRITSIMRIKTQETI